MEQIKNSRLDEVTAKKLCDMLRPLSLCSESGIVETLKSLDIPSSVNKVAHRLFDVSESMLISRAANMRPDSRYITTVEDAKWSDKAAKSVARTLYTVGNSRIGDMLNIREALLRESEFKATVRIIGQEGKVKITVFGEESSDKEIIEALKQINSNFESQVVSYGSCRLLVKIPSNMWSMVDVWVKDMDEHFQLLHSREEMLRIEEE